MRKIRKITEKMFGFRRVFRVQRGRKEPPGKKMKTLDKGGRAQLYASIWGEKRRGHYVVKRIRRRKTKKNKTVSANDAPHRLQELSKEITNG